MSVGSASNQTPGTRLRKVKKGEMKLSKLKTTILLIAFAVVAGYEYLFIVECL